jgi:hypothetical protein
MNLFFSVENKLAKKTSIKQKHIISKFNEVHLFFILKSTIETVYRCTYFFENKCELES